MERGIKTDREVHSFDVIYQVVSRCHEDSILPVSLIGHGVDRFDPDGQR